MSRHSARHAKMASRYEARHARPGGPGPAALAGAAAKAVPASLVAGAAGSALVLSSTAAVAAASPPARSAYIAPADLAAAKTGAMRATISPAVHTTASRGRHAAGRRDYTVVAGDTLSQVSARFCGTPADYPSLAAASGIANADLIYPGQSIKLACHHATVILTADSRPGGGNTAPPASGALAPSSQTAAAGGMSAFEVCVISRESGGNPQAVNPSSGAGGLFQFLPSTWAALGYAGGYPGGAQTAPVSVQQAAFAKLYAEAGTSPWAPYDGC
jgi:LysM repeat protein